jgi:tetratricopeptide (TPR) repeat protein
VAASGKTACRFCFYQDIGFFEELGAMKLVRYTSFALWLFSLVASAACSSSSEGISDGAMAPDGGATGPTRPSAVKLCYSEMAENHAATLAFRKALDNGSVADRAAVTADLKTAMDQYPDEEEFALLHGLANVWRLGEPLPAEVGDQVGLITTVTAARSSLELAYSLCPTDHRIPAWLGPIVINWGRALMNQDSIDLGLKILQQGIDAYPSFVLFSKVLVYADRPKTDPDFQQALAAIDANVETCKPGDPACVNTSRVPHNIEGAMIFLGDTYAKAGQKDRALERYQSIMKEVTYPAWDYQTLLADRIATLDSRVAAFNTADTADDPVSAWNDTNQCSICHKQ